MPSLSFQQQQKLALNQRLITGLQILQLPQAAVEQMITEALSENPLLTVKPSDATAPTTFSTSVTAISADDWLDEIDVAESSLRDHLIWQLDTGTIAPRLVPVVHLLIDSLDDDGYLRIPPTELSQTHDIEPSILSSALHELQQFDPAGVGARDLMECLRLQLNDPQAQAMNLAVRQVADQLLDHPLWLSDYPNSQSVICQALALDRQTCEAAIGMIQSLNPNPGSALNTSHGSYGSADLHVVIKGEKCLINTTATRTLQINTDFIDQTMASLHETAANNTQQREAKTWLQQQKNAGETLIQAIQYRFDTLAKLADYLQHTQSAYFAHGLSALRPQRIIEAAEALAVSPSTLSRAATHKIIESPQGIEPIRRLFSPPLPQQPNLTVRYAKHSVQSLIRDEPADRPLSDALLVTELAKQGIQLSRRTVTKYRLTLHIGNSRQRKIR